MTASLDKLTELIIGGAIEVHRALGPGLLESAYEHCLAYELAQSGLTVVRQKALPVRYKGTEIDCAYRLDLIIENSVVIELKCVDAILPLHQAQLLSYLRLADVRVGLLLNFHVGQLKQGGIKRLVNNYRSTTE